MIFIFAIAAVFLLTTAIPMAINYLSLTLHITSARVIRKALLHCGRINNLASLLLVFKHELHNQHSLSSMLTPLHRGPRSIPGLIVGLWVYIEPCNFFPVTFHTFDVRVKNVQNQGWQKSGFF